MAKSRVARYLGSLGLLIPLIVYMYYALIEMEMGAEITGKLIHEPRRNAGRHEPEIKPAPGGAAADSAG